MNIAALLWPQTGRCRSLRGEKSGGQILNSEGFDSIAMPFRRVKASQNRQQGRVLSAHLGFSRSHTLKR